MVTDERNAIAGAIMAEAKAIAGAAAHAPDVPEQTRSQLTPPSSPWAASIMRNIEQDLPRLKAERRLLPVAGLQCPELRRLLQRRRRRLAPTAGIGAVASARSLQTKATIGLVTSLVARAAGTDAVAGFGMAARLEYLLVPLAFGLGAPLVARVGTNIGAGQQDRALRIALIGGCIAFVLTEAAGVVASTWPGAWLALFSAKPNLIKTSSESVRMIWPAYGFFGLGMALYFPSQGVGRLFWLLASGFLRMAMAVGGG
jgi:Na+-driven multidrug efflux pump